MPKIKDLSSQKAAITEIYDQQIQQPYHGRAVVSFKLLLLLLFTSVLGGILGGLIHAGWFSGQVNQNVNQPGNLNLNLNSDTTVKKTEILDLNSLLKDNTNNDAYAKVLHELKSQVVGFYSKKAAVPGIFDSLYLEKDFLGSGVIVTSDGWILAPRSVVKDQNYIIVTADKRIFDPQKAVVDNFSNSVLVKIEAKNLSPVSFSDLSTLKTTDTLLSLRYTLKGNGNSEIIKTAVAKFFYHDQGKGADFLLASDKEDHYLKMSNDFEALYNGAPLFNDKGQVAGLLFNSGRSIIDLAIPAYYLKSGVSSFLTSSSVVARPSLGVNYLDLSEVLGLSADVSENRLKGAVLLGDAKRSITAIVPNSPAAKAGLQAGDIIVKINNEELNESDSLTKLIQEYPAGQEITLTISRKGNEQDVKITLGKL
ncbi:MAG: PDZ domain-containing protein [Candidatus Komeilibacteria bacterium]|nr:PDZ domain-containing protein [Candidatus Komeilibacteria bacterium]